jgi:hypothetical protein
MLPHLAKSTLLNFCKELICFPLEVAILKLYKVKNEECIKYYQINSRRVTCSRDLSSVNEFLVLKGISFL